jgi:hypothetical protein
MRLSNKHRGFALPAVLVVAGALLILAVGALLVVGIERNTARSFVDRERAELAARAGLEDVRGILVAETANDDFVVIQSTLENPTTQGAEPAPHLFIARGKEAGGADDDVDFRYIPLFSAADRPDDGSFKAPEIESLTGGTGEHIDFTTLPWLDKARAAWLPVRDDKGRIVARYAYWVEDLQGRVDPAIAGNDDPTPAGDDPPPVPGIDTDHPERPILGRVALWAIDPLAVEGENIETGKTIIDNRSLLLSPESTLAAAEIDPPLDRLTEPASDGGYTGQLVNPTARAIEKAAIGGGLVAYEEKPVIPFARGIDPSMHGQPKLNLNELLQKPANEAVDQMAEHIRKALPDFDSRKGGLPSSEDYLKNIAANALDYADSDSDPRVSDGFRGFDAMPLLSEEYLQFNYRGIYNKDGRKILGFKIIRCVELWNMSDQPIEGTAQVSYEVDLRPQTGIGASPNRYSFDDFDLLSDANQVTHTLEWDADEGKFWSAPVQVELGPNQYKFYQFAEVDYELDVGDSSIWIPGGSQFVLSENEGSRGMSLRWNGAVIDRAGKIKRIDSVFGNSADQFRFSIGTKKTVSKASIPAHSYRSLGNYYNNIGDSRITYYLRSIPVDDNASPENLSPNRRNLRRSSVYKNPAADYRGFYGRVLPSEWPDGGHNSPVGNWPITTSETVLPIDVRYNFDSTDKQSAPQRISNIGRFFSATEMGKAFDPILRLPAYPNSSDTSSIRSGFMPRNHHPDYILDSFASSDYGGGSTLRIGRREHPLFDKPGLRASYLVDLFHAGSTEDPDANVLLMESPLNLNTASRDAIRVLAAGLLRQDPIIANVVSWRHRNLPFAAPTAANIHNKIGAPETEIAADLIADAIIASRPFDSMGAVAAASTEPIVTDGRNPDPNQVFGNRDVYSYGENLEWNDAAAEEVFARVHDASTLRSRNFRVWVVAQSLQPRQEGSTAEPEVLAEVRKSFVIGPVSAGETNKYVIRYENDF